MERLGKYGENPHQIGYIERDENYEGPSVIREPLNGNSPGYNNLLDANAALETMIDFNGLKAACVVKHQTVCGLATGETLREALDNAWDGDEVSAFGGIVGFSQRVDLETMKGFSSRHVDMIVGPSFSKEAINWINSRKTKERTIVIAADPDDEDSPYSKVLDFNTERKIRGGTLSQTGDSKLYLTKSIEELFEHPKQMTEDNSGIKYNVGNVTDAEFHEDMKGLVGFAIKAGKNVKSNAILIAYEYDEGKYRILGAGGGQANRLESVKISTRKCKENLMRQFFREQRMDYVMTMDRMMFESEYNKRLTEELREYADRIMESNDIVLFTDAFFPFPDGLRYAAESGIKYIISPGGSKNDDKVIEAADELDVAMMFTGIRHFKH